jgi:Protein of unknown function (DUF4199)
MNENACFVAWFNPKKKHFMQRHVLKYGIIAGLILTVIGTINYSRVSQSSDFSGGEVLGYLSMIVSLSMVFFGVRSFRDQHLQGSISFGAAFKIGLMITLIASVFYVAGWMIYYNFSPALQDFPDKYLAHLIEELNKKGGSPEEIARKTEQYRRNMELYKKPFVMIGMSFLEILPVGLVIDLISAFILRKKPQGAE